MKRQDITPCAPAQRPFRPISSNVGLSGYTPPRDPLARLQKRLLALAGDGARIVATQSRPWASATFIGAQHLLTLEIEENIDGQAAQAFVDTLPEAEFAIPGHIVADAVVDSWEIIQTSDRKTNILRMTFLTIEDW